MGSKLSGNRTHKPRAPGAGRKPKPPRIVRNNLVMCVAHLTREQRTDLMLTIRRFWFQPPQPRP